MDSRRDAFVGRGAELAELADALGRARAGHGELRLLVGEPGIGKTRLADELAAAASAGGAIVAWGRCWEAGGAPAFWPWTQALSAAARSLEAEALARAVGDDGGTLAQLVPSLGGPSAPIEGEQARFLLFQAVSGFLRRMTAAAPLLLVLDDLHAADPSSAHLLHFVARDLRGTRLLILGTYRDVEARLSPEVGEALAKVAREGRTLTLRRLAREEAAEFVGGATAAAAVDSIFRATQGNPLFLHEMVRLLEAEGGLDRAVGPASMPLPYGVREVIRQRIGRLSPEARGVLDVAAVLGDELEAGLLGEVAGLDVDGALAAAVTHGLMIERGGGRFRFAHALMREALYRDLPRSRRLELHAAVAAALERRVDAPPDELAHHLLEGGPEHLPRGVHHAIRAAERAAGMLAFEDAVAGLERVREVASGDERLRAEVLLALGSVTHRAGEITRGKELSRQAAELARRLGDGVLLARAALGYGAEIAVGYVDPVLVGLLEESLRVLAPNDLKLRALVMARLAGALQPAPDPETPIALAREAIALARQEGDPANLMAVIHAGMSALMDFADPEERAPLNQELYRLAVELGDRVAALRAQRRLIIDSIELGDIQAADAAIERCDHLAGELRLPHLRWWVPLFRSMRAMMEGRFADSERAIAECLTLREAANYSTDGPFVELHRLGLALTRADAAAVAGWRMGQHEFWEFAAQGASLMYTVDAMRAARCGDAAEARRAIARVLPDQIRGFDLSPLAFVAEAAALAGDELRAQLALDLLWSRRERHVSWGVSAAGYDGPVARVLALAADLLGREDFSALFESALEKLAAFRARPLLARTSYEYARALGRRGRSAEAAQRLGEARAIAEELGLSGLIALIDREGKPAPRPVAAVTFSLRREAEYWSVEHGGAVHRFKDSRGFQILARLVAEPDREFHATDLAAGGVGEEDAGGDAGELLDREAREEYRRRLEDLREELTEAESFGDRARVTRLGEERDFIAAELARAVGLGGRERKAAATSERARVAVQRRLRDAIRRIAQVDPALGEHLQWAVRTGAFCSYRSRGTLFPAG